MEAVSTQTGLLLNILFAKVPTLCVAGYRKRCASSGAEIVNADEAKQGEETRRLDLKSRS
jgi:hypothetical protein